MQQKVNKQSRAKVSKSWILPTSIILLGLAEISILALIGAKTSAWWVLLILLGGIVVSLALLLAAGQQSISRLLSIFRALRGKGDISKHFSRPAFTLLAAFLFFFPGVITDLLALILLFTPVQRFLITKAGLSSEQLMGRRLNFGKSSAAILPGEVVSKSKKPESNKTPPLIEGDVL